MNTKRNFPSARTVAAGAAAITIALNALTGGAHAQGTSPRFGVGTYLGGNGTDYGEAIAFDAQGNVYLGISSFSSTLGNDTLDRFGGADILIAKLSPDRKTLLDAVTLGSSREDHIGGMAVTPQGEVVLAIETDGAGFPLKNAVRTAIIEDNPGVLLKINTTMDDLVFSTFTDFTVKKQTHAVGIDNAGNIHVAGFVYKPAGSRRNLTLERFSPAGQKLASKVWDDDASGEPQGMTVRGDGAVYIVGATVGRFTQLAPTDNAVQVVCGAKLALGSAADCDEDAFVMRVNPAGVVDYTTFLGGTGNDKAVDIAVDAQGAMVLTGVAGGKDFPTMSGALQKQCNTTAQDGLCVYDTFVAKLSADGKTLVYSTILASRDENGLDYPGAIAVDAAGNAIVTGYTASAQWPVLNASAAQPALNAAPCPNAFQDRLCFDATVTTFSPSGAQLFSSYLGGKFDEYANDVTVSATGGIYVMGTTESRDLPATTGGLQPAPGSSIDAFVAVIAASSTQAPPTPTTEPVRGDKRLFLPTVQR